MPKILMVTLVLLVASMIEADALQGRILSFGTNACEDFVARPTDVFVLGRWLY
jgi:hypothetical protein